MRVLNTSTCRQAVRTWSGSWVLELFYTFKTSLWPESPLLHLAVPRTLPHAGRNDWNRTSGWKSGRRPGFPECCGPRMSGVGIFLPGGWIPCLPWESPGEFSWQEGPASAPAPWALRGTGPGHR